MQKPVVTRPVVTGQSRTTSLTCTVMTMLHIALQKKAYSYRMVLYRNHENILFLREKIVKVYSTVLYGTSTGTSSRIVLIIVLGLINHFVLIFLFHEFHSSNKCKRYIRDYGVSTSM